MAIKKLAGDLQTEGDYICMFALCGTGCRLKSLRIHIMLGPNEVHLQPLFM